MNRVIAGNFLLAAMGAFLTVSQPANAAYVMPQMGGGQVGMMGAPMKHADITFDGTNLAVHVDDTVGTPVLRPLTPPDEFDPAQPWSVLSGKAYNFQLAWNPGGFITLPSGTGIWVERLFATPGLETYLRPPMWTSGATWTPILAADGARWQWSGSMQHNAYAMLNPTLSSYETSYRVYLGEETTGTPLLGYGSADVTWKWSATPVPEPIGASLLLVSGMLILRRQR